MRVRIIEIEAEGEAVVEAIRHFGYLAGPSPVAVATQPKALPAPREPRQKQRKAAAQETEGDGAAGQTRADLVRRALADGPKTSGQIVEYLRACGRAVKSQQVCCTLWTLEHQDEARRGADRRWILVR